MPCTIQPLKQPHHGPNEDQDSECDSYYPETQPERQAQLGNREGNDADYDTDAEDAHKPRQNANAMLGPLETLSKCQWFHWTVFQSVKRLTILG